MEQNDEKLAGSNMTSIAEYSQSAAGLAELRTRLRGVVYDVTTTRGMDAAKRDRRELVTLRTSLEAKRKEIKGPALERCRLIDEEAKRITSEIRALEEPIDVQIKAEEARKEAERLSAIEAERQRVEAIMSKISHFRELPGKVASWPSGRIASELSTVQATVVGEAEYQEHTAQAIDAHAACVARLQQLLADAKAREEEAERVRKLEEAHAAQQAEIERLRKEAEERNRLDSEAQEIADRAAQAERERHAEEQRHEAIRKAEEARKEAEKAKADAKAAKLASLGLRKAVEIAHDYFVEHGVAELREQMEAALRNDDQKAAKA